MTSTATSTWTCTAATASRWPGTGTRRSWPRSSARSARGTHFAQPTRTRSRWRRELARRFGLPQWRFANSGTEATMDAVHLMRAITGRDLIIKVEGCYHGHHDSVQVSVCPEAGRDRPGRPAGQRAVQQRHPAGDHRPDPGRRLQRPRPPSAGLLAEHPGQIAGMIIEPIMMNAGIILPEPGYLAGLTDLLHAHGALLTFDEVKTGLTAGPPAAPPASPASPRTSSAWPRRSAAASRWPRSAAPPR